MMEFLGIGVAELVILLGVMLVVAGPQRMLRWSFILGQAAGRLQRMWRQAALSLQQELDKSGVDVTVPQQIPTRQTLQREMQQALRKAARPVNDSMATLKADLQAHPAGSVAETPHPNDTQEKAAGLSH